MVDGSALAAPCGRTPGLFDRVIGTSLEL